MSSRSRAIQRQMKGRAQLINLVLFWLSNEKPGWIPGFFHLRAAVRGEELT